MLPNAFKAPLFTLALLCLVYSNAQASEIPAADAPVSAARTAVPEKDKLLYGNFDEAEFATFSKMNFEEGSAYLSAQRLKIIKMTDAERKAYYEERQKVSKAYTPEQKAAMRDARHKWYAALPADYKAKMLVKTQERQALKQKEKQDLWNKLPPAKRQVMQLELKQKIARLPKAERAKAIERLRREKNPALPADVRALSPEETTPAKK